jgi:predicted DsbA family dithiol-disulfide isomerase
MDVKVLGSGCVACQAMYSDVNRIIARNGWRGIQVEYVQDIERIMSYNVMTTPVLVINEKVVMLGHRGTAKLEHALHKGYAA